MKRTSPWEAEPKRTLPLWTVCGHSGSVEAWGQITSKVTQGQECWVQLVQIYLSSDVASGFRALVQWGGSPRAEI